MAENEDNEERIRREQAAAALERVGGFFTTDDLHKFALAVAEAWTKNVGSVPTRGERRAMSMSIAIVTQMVSVSLSEILTETEEEKN